MNRFLQRALVALLLVATTSTCPAFADEVLPVPDAGNLVEYRGQNESVGTFHVTGATDGTVYGTGIYTDDSDLATAAVHAGLVKPGETRDLSVEILPGRAGYRGSGEHGITSGDYGQWPGSFKFLDAAEESAAAGDVIADPGSLEGYRNQVGQTFSFTVTGSTAGAIYGDGTYTDDSVLATAAVHAGILAPGETGTVTVAMLPGQAHYVSATRNNIHSFDFGSWPGSSYRFVKPGEVASNASSAALPDPGDMKAYRGRNGQVFSFSVIGNARGSVWGSGIYSDDTNIAVAAVHAGLLADGQSGVVSVEVLPGQTKYQGATKNGVNSLNYDHWEGSYEFVDPATGQAIAP